MDRKGSADILTLLKSLIVGTMGALTYLYQPFFSGTVPPTPSPSIAHIAEVSPKTIQEIFPDTFYTVEFGPPNIATESAAQEILPDLYSLRAATIATNSNGGATPTVQTLPSSTPSPTVTPTLRPTPTSRPQPTALPTIEASISTTVPSVPASTPIPTLPHSLNAEYLFQLINQHRETLQLPAFQKNEYLCKVAQDRLPELPDEASGKKYIHQGLYDRKLPYWITENMAYYQSEEANFRWWLNSSVHRRAIEGNYQYSCGVCNGNICIQLFTNFNPR